MEQNYETFIAALNDFIHTWMIEFKDVELVYVYFDEEDIEYMYIIWANGSQSRLNLSYNYPCFSSILENFLNRRGNYESVPDDEYI